MNSTPPPRGPKLVTEIFPEIKPMELGAWLAKAEDGDWIRVIRTREGSIALQNRSNYEVYWVKP